MKLTKEKEEQLVKLMEQYNASDLGDLMDIFPDLVLELHEDELPQQEEVDLAEHFLSYKEPAVPMDASCPFSI